MILWVVACKLHQRSCLSFSQHSRFRLLSGQNRIGIQQTYLRIKQLSKRTFLNKRFGIASAAVLLCGGLAYGEVRWLNKKIKTLPDEVNFEKSLAVSSDIIADVEEAHLMLQSVVTLARSKTTDPSQFTPFLPLQHQDYGQSEHELLKLIGYFPVKSVGKCTKYFMNVALLREVKAMSTFLKEAIWTFEGNDLLMPELTKQPVDQTTLVLLLQSILGYCQIDRNCTELVRQKGLELLRHIYDQHLQDKLIVHAIGRILSILTLCRWLHQDILKSGWVSIFADWMRSSDLVLSLLATKSLANMDDRCSGNCFYGDGVYLYHPQYVESEPIHADIVFIHGLLGGPFKTWRQKDRIRDDPKNNQHQQEKEPTSNDIMTEKMTVENYDPSDKLYTLCWPKDWLAVDCPGLRMVSVEYESRLSNWSVGCPYESERKTIDVLSKELLHKLELAGIGKRPIIWVGHSMGGLLIKEILRIANDVPLLRPLVKQTKGIVFYSIPHKGSSLAGFGRRVSYLLYPSVEVRQLSPGSQKLKSLHASFKDLMSEEAIPLLSFVEGQPTKMPFNIQAKIVPEDSGDPGFGEFHVMPQLNHLNICKPENKNSDLYQLTVAFVQRCLSQITDLKCNQT